VEFDRGGLPTPELQTWVGGGGVVVGRADFLWRQYSTIAEADGAIKYADPDRARMQLRRDADLRAAGFEVVHFSWQELRLNPAQVIASIRTAFARSTALRIGEAVRSSGAN
jgi:very-short-patch-repair endonuclease